MLPKYSVIFFTYFVKNFIFFYSIIAIKHEFQYYMYILPVTREIIKTEGFNISFGTQRTLMHVNPYTDNVMNVDISDISVYTGRAQVQ